MSLSSDDLATTLQKRGVKNAQNASRALRFVGSDGKESFRETAVRLAGAFEPEDTDVAELGQFYSRGVYRGAVSGERSYEPIYDGVDWTKSVSDPTVEQILKEFYGDTEATLTEADKARLQEILGNTKTKTNTSSAREYLEGLAAAQNGNQTMRDEETLGIRGVREFDATIDSIA